MTASQARVYKAGLARGRLLAKQAEHKKRSRAAAQAARTRAERKAKPPEPKPVAAVPELVLFDIPATEDPPPVFTPPAAWPAKPVTCRYRVFLNTADTEPEERDGEFVVEWEAETLPKSFWRDVRQLIDTWRAENPDAESPQAGLIYFSLALDE